MRWESAGASPDKLPEKRFLLIIFSLGFDLPLGNGPSEQGRGRGDGQAFPSQSGPAAELSDAAEHRHRRLPAACTSMGAELRRLEKSVLNKGGFSVKAQPCQGRSCPSHCQEGSHLLCLQPRGWAASREGYFWLRQASSPPAPCPEGQGNSISTRAHLAKRLHN